MNKIQQIEATLRNVLPTANVRMQPAPSNPDGMWWLDVGHKGVSLVIQWSSKKGFGLSNVTDDSNPGYGEGPEEVFETREEVLARVAQLLWDGPGAPKEPDMPNKAVKLMLDVPPTIEETNSDHVGHMVGVINTILDSVSANSGEQPLKMYFLQVLSMQYLAKSSRRDIMRRLTPEQWAHFLEMEKAIELQLLANKNIDADNKH